MGGYKDKTIRMDFAELGNGCYVVIKNPALEPMRAQAPLSAELTPDERSAANLERSQKGVADLIVEWLVWDLETDEPLLSPKDDPTVMAQCPNVILTAIAEEIAKRTNPFRKKETPTTTS